MLLTKSNSYQLVSLKISLCFSFYDIEVFSVLVFKSMVASSNQLGFHLELVSVGIVGVGVQGGSSNYVYKKVTSAWILCSCSQH